MRARAKVLCGAIATASGLAVGFLSTGPFNATFFHTVAFGPYYQLLVGALMLVIGFCTGSICFEELSFLAKVVYFLSGAVLFVLGVFVFTNIDRYGFIFSHLGTWPIYVIGALIAFNGAISLGYALAVYTPPQPA